jgi:uncharacterized protein (DUF2164 family)
MRNKNSITLTKEKRSDMNNKKLLFKGKGRIIGDLASGLILDFIIEKLAPEFYNQGVSDSHKYMQISVEDLLSIQK